ncbi:vitamin B12-dependent ribonucleotide reductase [Myxococcota bacterium]|nr:vitamin B12-dependent ribonucleotide reductase [Myxococcota bacterium]
METRTESTTPAPGAGRRARRNGGAGVSGETGLKVERRRTRPGDDVFASVEWELRDAVITGEKGDIVFEQRDVEVPKTWSQLATNVVVSKYFRGHVGTPGRERSVRQLVSRVADTLGRWGTEGGYFSTDEDASAFRDELAWYLLHQATCFNSPVWFNMGIEPQPQCSACFINSVEDSMESIMRLAGTEARLFKGGSGTGSNLSRIRSSRERLNGGGTASGPVSFMKGYDAFAGVIKSGGKTRRAAKMVILDVDHPDIVDFIRCKEEEEKKAWALIDAGYDGSFNGEAYASVFFQNSNNSVRVTDDFMRAVEQDGPWETRAVTDGQVMEAYRARDLFRMMAQAAWVCGDPGIQFDTVVNRWHTSPNTARINASNPCSEYMFLDDSACNLASLNLMKFLRPDGTFDVDGFEHCVSVTITAMEIIVGNSSYPNDAIARNSLDYRPLGIGYANLGALLMARGLPYDGAAGRASAAAITALMTGAAYRTSALIARHIGPFAGYERNREPTLRVMRQHRAAVDGIDARLAPPEVVEAARQSWDDVVDYCTRWGVRNAQASVLAPTGTIGFMMDCDTTGVEPDIALVKYKKLVGGGLMKIVNNTVPMALRNLGYDATQVADVVAYIDENDTIEGAPHLQPEHLPVFDCAFRPANGTRSIHWLGHLRMMGAVQPFLSGAISKTVNMPSDSTPEDIEKAYMEAWRLGIKAVAVYRDGCKRTQPLNTAKDAARKKAEPAAVRPEARRPVRRRLQDERQAITHKFSVGGHEGYLTVGLYEDGQPGEIFVVMSKQGSTISGLMDNFATAVSMALQYGVPLHVLADKFSHTRFEPQGWTPHPEIPYAKSITDYIFRWLSLKFLKPDEALEDADPAADPGVEGADDGAAAPEAPVPPAHGLANGHAPGYSNGVHGGSAARDRQETREKAIFLNQADAPPCHVCGTLMVRNGSCYRCPNCASTSGCS